MICPKCGTANAVGDAFCGSCGAFLEFALAEAAERDAGDAATAPADGPAGTGQSSGGAPASTQFAAPASGASATQSGAPAWAMPASGATSRPPAAEAPIAPASIAPIHKAPAPITPALETGPTCAVCGRLNPAGRTFCISCGEKLSAGPAAGARADQRQRGGAAPAAAAWGASAAGAPTTPTSTPSPPAARAGSPSAAAGRRRAAGTAASSTPAGPSLPATPATPPTAAWEFPTSPAARAGTPTGTAATTAVKASTGTTSSGDGPSRRLPLLVGGVVAVAAIAAGLAFILTRPASSPGSTPAPTLVAASIGIATPSPAATPGGSASPAATPGASEGESPAPTPNPTDDVVPTPSPAATPGPSFPVGNPVGIRIRSAKASSQLSAARAPKFAIDGDTTTTWKTGPQTTNDEWLEITIDRAALTRIQIWGGWQVTLPLYQGNRRPHNISVRFDNRNPIGVELKDVFASQHVDLPASLGLVGVTRIRFTILDWYPARKTTAGGSPTTQTPISEIRVFGIPMP